MKIKILGAHNIESRTAGLVSLLIDGVLALDAGALASRLSFTAQQKIRAVLLTHQHYDHVRDIPALGMNFYLHEKTVDLYGSRHVLDALARYMLNDELYPDFLKRPAAQPAVRFNTLEPGKEATVQGYRVLPVPVSHGVPTTGFQVTAPGGEAFFFTADTGPGLAEAWRQVAPGLLIAEVTAPDAYEDFARRSGHLTPALLRQELEELRRIKGCLPPVVVLHMNPMQEKEIREELAAVAGALDADIRLACEGMRLDL